MNIVTVKVEDGMESIGVIEGEYTFEDMQTLVGGYIEAIQVGPKIYMLVNEDGIPLGLPINSLGLRGNVLFVGKNLPWSDEFDGLTFHQINTAYELIRKARIKYAKQLSKDKN